MTVLTLTEPQAEMLRYLSDIEGCDVWDRPHAGTCRQLETLGLVRIVKAKNAPKDGAQQQPYFGAKITADGRKAVSK